MPSQLMGFKKKSKRKPTQIPVVVARLQKPTVKYRNIALLAPQAHTTIFFRTSHLKLNIAYIALAAKWHEI